jgi:hypothetical protein
LVPAPAGGDDVVGIGASCEGLWFSIALVSTKMTDVAFDSAELVARRALRSFDQKKSVAYPGRFSVRVAIWLPRLLPRNAWLALPPRRPAKDFENLTRNALAFLRLASIRLMLRKLCNQ